MPYCVACLEPPPSLLPHSTGCRAQEKESKDSAHDCCTVKMRLTVLNAHCDCLSSSVSECMCASVSAFASKAVLASCMCVLVCLRVWLHLCLRLLLFHCSLCLCHLLSLHQTFSLCCALSTRESDQHQSPVLSLFSLSLFSLSNSVPVHVLSRSKPSLQGMCLLSNTVRYTSARTNKAARASMVRS